MESQRDKFLTEVNRYLKKKMLVQYRNNPKITKYFSEIYQEYLRKKKPTLRRRIKYLFTGNL